MKHLGKSQWQVWRMSNKLGLRKIKKWTEEEKQFLRTNAHQGYKWLAEKLGVTYMQIDAAMARYKVKTGNQTQFYKGMNPWNAGKKIRMSPKSEFKKGMLPKNTMHDGAITIRRDKSGRPYKFVRLAKSKWDLYHRQLWMQANGPVPQGMIIIFKDNNTMNCELSNLEMITLRENMERNRNRPKQAASNAECWENGTRYENDEWIAKLIARGDSELQHELLQNKYLIETKRQQLLLRRQLTGKQLTTNNY